MRNAFLTERNWYGKIPIEYRHMRNDAAWMYILDATHYPIWNYEELDSFDNVFIMWPKGNIFVRVDGLKIANGTNPVTPLLEVNLAKQLKKKNKNVHFIQEGPSWLFNDYEIPEQFMFYEFLSEVTTIFTHNEWDNKFFKGIFPTQHITPLPPVMVEHSIKDIIPNPEEKVLIGGNFASWYGGFQSYVVSDVFGVEKWIQDSHAKRQYEDQIHDLNHFKRLDWIEWMKEVSKFKYAVHLMPIGAAGTFNLNCAYFGIPCIGNMKVDTQRICFPNLSVDPFDVESALMLAIKLKDDKNFYQECSEIAKENYKKYYTVEKFKEIMHEYF